MTHSATVLITIIGLAGCSPATAPAPTETRPDPRVNEQLVHDDVYEDAPYDAEAVTMFRTAEALADLDVRALAVVDDRVVAGTASGGFVLHPGAEAFERIYEGPTVVDLAVADDGRIFAASDAAVHVIGGDGQLQEQWPVASGGITAVVAHGNEVNVGSAQGLARVDGIGATEVLPMSGVSVRDLVRVGDVAWMATPAGIVRYDLVLGAELPTLLADDDVRALAFDGDRVVAATADGYATIALDNDEAVVIEPGLGGLPTGDLRAIAAADGVTVLGHGIGATIASGEVVRDHYHTERWIPAEEVTAVALGSDGTRWIATGAGVSRIALMPMTLADKADAFEPLLENHWRMDGFVADSANYADEWDHAGPPTLPDKDNDGLWTEMQIAGWCFAYASTGDERYYQRARRAMDVMQLLFDVPAATFEAQGDAAGFITRSLVRSDEVELFESKSDQNNWHAQKHDGQTYLWKDDTSSDEYAGHFFGIPVFYDLCAKSETERAAIRDRVAGAMRYLAAHDYELIDLDGLPTTHGDWKGLANAVDGLAECAAQGKEECGESFAGGGWLNSLEILGALLATWHMTGDDFFYDEYQRLAIDERYGEMVPISEMTLTVTSRGVANHSDHELATLAYFTLLRYEPNPERRELWLQSLRDMLSYEAEERNPLQIAVMASAAPDAAVSDAARTLREMPSDWRVWFYDNSHRQDAERDVDDRFDEAQFKTVFPYDEIRTMKWNGNPYAVADGKSGKRVQAPWPYLLPYWMLRYYGAL